MWHTGTHRATQSASGWHTLCFSGFSHGSTSDVVVNKRCWNCDHHKEIKHNWFMLFSSLKRTLSPVHTRWDFTWVNPLHPWALNRQNPAWTGSYCAVNIVVVNYGPAQYRRQVQSHSVTRTVTVQWVISREEAEGFMQQWLVQLPL